MVKKRIKKEDIKDNFNHLTEKSTSLIGEFKEFIARGNVMDLAVGVIIGGAFSNIVTSLTNNILMPIIGAIIGGLDFSSLSYTFKLWGREVPLTYGVFIQNVVDFLLTALCIFIMVKAINKIFHKKDPKKEEPKPEPKKSDEVVLLEEIRDLLKSQNKAK